jgi:hypothetical protein
MMRTAAKVDANHAAIVDALRKAGCSVTSTAAIGKGFPDLVVGILGRNLLLEVKDGDKPPSAQKLTVDELKWQAAWRGEVVVVSSVTDALELVGNVRRGTV